MKHFRVFGKNKLTDLPVNHINRGSLVKKGKQWLTNLLSGIDDLMSFSIVILLYVLICFVLILYILISRP